MSDDLDDDEDELEFVGRNGKRHKLWDCCGCLSTSSAPVQPYPDNADELSPLHTNNGRTSSKSSRHRPPQQKSAKALKPKYDVSRDIVESLAWQAKKHRSGRTYYSSALSGATTWERPANFHENEKLSKRKASMKYLQQAVTILSRYGIELLIHRGGPVEDKQYGNKVGGKHAALSHCLFYQAFLIPELALYPLDFVAKVGLRRIVLLDRLEYRKQPRKAVPVLKTGTLYLDPKPEALYYLQDVLHHEFFHIIDVVMRREAVRDPITKKLTRKVTYYDPDAEWSAFNTPGFEYGDGGQNARGETAFISGATNSDGAVQKGFLNRYSMSALEEDKAEIFAAMIRYPPAMFKSKDRILRNKAWLMRRRLEHFCPSLSAAFWTDVGENSGTCTRLLQSYSPDAWTSKTDLSGKSFWFNSHTHQTSWLDPALFQRQNVDDDVSVGGDGGHNSTRESRDTSRRNSLGGSRGVAGLVNNDEANKRKRVTAAYAAAAAAAAAADGSNGASATEHPFSVVTNGAGSDDGGGDIFAGSDVAMLSGTAAYVSAAATVASAKKRRLNELNSLPLLSTSSATSSSPMLTPVELAVGKPPEFPSLLGTPTTTTSPPTLANDFVSLPAPPAPAPVLPTMTPFADAAAPPPQLAPIAPHLLPRAAASTTAARANDGSPRVRVVVEKRRPPNT
jgi:hypothetical protein